MVLAGFFRARAARPPIAHSLVTVDKVGSGNYYWRFPSSTVAALAARAAKLERQIEANREAAAAAAAQAENLADARTGGDERETLLARLAELEALERQQKARLADLRFVVICFFLSSNFLCLIFLLNVPICIFGFGDF